MHTPAGRPPSRRPRLLVVDDERDAADSLATLLKAWGCDATAAYTGKTAIELVDALRPDAVLLDLCMPHGNGFEICRAIRACPWATEMVVLAVTGAAEEMESALSEAKFDGVLSKPIDPTPLRNLLDWLRLRSHPPGGTTPHPLRSPRITPRSAAPPA